MTLTTLEGRQFELVYSVIGIIDKASDSKYETFESFLITNSPLYTERFNKALFDKLSALQQEESDDD